MMKLKCFILSFVACLFTTNTSVASDDVLISKTVAYPTAYADEALHQGRIEHIAYTTRDYAEGTGVIRQNEVYVYLPYPNFHTHKIATLAIMGNFNH